MTDKQFLEWLRDRLIFVYNESANVDFVIRLNEIIRDIEKPRHADVYTRTAIVPHKKK